MSIGIIKTTGFSFSNQGKSNFRFIATLKTEDNIDYGANYISYDYFSQFLYVKLL